MSLLNNLRKSIVRKLIRPEDGCILVGKETKLLYNEEDDMYILGMHSTNNDYYKKPTLVGWRDGWVHSMGAMEVSFSEWIYGVLDNICEQYSEKLDTLDVSEIKRLSRRKNGEKLMINKESFCSIMTVLDKYYNDLHKIEDVLNVIFENNALTAIFDGIVDALEEDLEPDLPFNEEPMLYDWLFNYDAGRKEKAKEGIDGWPLTTSAELYDYLVWKRDVKSNETKVESYGEYYTLEE